MFEYTVSHITYAIQGHKGTFSLLSGVGYNEKKLVFNYLKKQVHVHCSPKGNDRSPESQQVKSSERAIAFSVPRNCNVSSLKVPEIKPFKHNAMSLLPSTYNYVNHHRSN